MERAKTNVVLTSTPLFDRLTDYFNNVQAIFDVIYNSHQLPQVFGAVWVLNRVAKTPHQLNFTLVGRVQAQIVQSVMHLPKE